MEKRQQHDETTTNPMLGSHEYVYHWFAFFQGWLEGRSLKPHHSRDAVAFRELCVALDARGGSFDETFMNGPATPKTTKHYRRKIGDLVDRNEEPRIEEVARYRPVDESFLKPGHLLVVSTRLPMDDFQQMDKVQVQPGFTSLEQKIIRLCRRYFRVVARSRVRLGDEVAAHLPKKYANRADIRFKATSEPWYTALTTANATTSVKRSRVPERRTAGYLLRLPAVPELNGADLLVMFGLGGTQTLAFAKRLRSDLSGLLDHDGLSMVEMIVPEPAESSDENVPESFRLFASARQWEMRVLLEGVLLEPGGGYGDTPTPGPATDAPPGPPASKAGRRTRRSPQSVRRDAPSGRKRASEG